MPRPKKTDRQKKDDISVDLHQDREEFLRAFEKPTQIYRFLRARHCISPIFLHRSLFYMQDRCSRTNGRRKLFRVNNLLKSCQSKLPEPIPPQYNQLKILVSAFCIDPGVANENYLQKKYSDVETEVCIRKSLRCRRKDNESQQTEDLIGSTEVPVNPKSSRFPHESEAITLNTDDMQCSRDGQPVKTYTLVFRVFETQDEESESEMESSDLEMSETETSDGDGSGKKRKREHDPAAVSLRNLTTGTRRSTTNDDTKSKDGDRSSVASGGRKSRRFSNSAAPSEKTAIYEAELSIFSADKETLLVDGEYELSMTRKLPDENDYKRNATWEALDGGRNIEALSAMNNCPLLKFSLKWSEEGCSGPLAGLESSTSEPDAKRMRRRTNKNLGEDASGNPASNVPVFPVDSVEYRKSNMKKKSNQNREDGNQRKQVVFYQFIYNSETQQQTEARDDLYCPWCQLNCITLYSLVKHLKVCHPRFNFAYVPQENGSSIEVSVNECYDSSYCGNPQFIFAQPGMAFSRRGPVRRIQVTDTLVYRPKRERHSLNMDLNELLEKEENETSPAAHYAAGHHRLYFHSETVVPIRPCEFDVDSEEETDPEWLRAHTTKMLDEFTDVNDGEKPIMKLWNLYIMKHSCIADAQMLSTCREFLNQYTTLIVKHSLRRNLLLHFVTLVDFGVLKASALCSLMDHFDELSAGVEAPAQPIQNGTHHPNNATTSITEPDMAAKLKQLQEIIENDGMQIN
uniref:polycomb protein suz12-A n=1 Tax=Ciona intestinalis TaxID=7719 RepID=UPI000180CA5C|nr:polycomb protein suz12-A [Ciona intestinalis]|eukprot:XP_002129124.1 polycomb protein suz12-A [Ciona intestinalis]